MERPNWAPEEIDIDRPSIARTYDYWLGGFHNFEADRAVAEYTNKFIPQGPALARTNRAFLGRVVGRLLDAGVTQFLDLGSGIPTVGNVHEIAGRRDQSSRVVYVDIDPVAVAHSRAILAGSERAAAIQADLMRVDDVLAAPEVARLLDLSQPVAVLLVSVLHFVPDARDPSAVIARYFEHLVPGSHLAISTGSDDDLPPGFREALRALYEREVAQITYRSRAQVEALAGGLTPVEPGVAWIEEWWPLPGERIGMPEEARHFTYGGLWRKDENPAG